MTPVRGQRRGCPVVIAMAAIVVSGCGGGGTKAARIPATSLVPTTVVVPSTSTPTPTPTPTPTTTTMPPAAGLTRYVDPTAGFSLDYPQAWTQSSSPESTVHLLLSAGSGGLETLLVRVNHLQSDPPGAPAAVKAYTDQLLRATRSRSASNGSSRSMASPATTTGTG